MVCVFLVCLLRTSFSLQLHRRFVSLAFCVEPPSVVHEPPPAVEFLHFSSCIITLGPDRSGNRNHLGPAPVPERHVSAHEKRVSVRRDARGMAQNGESSGAANAGATSPTLDGAIAAATNPPGIIVLDRDYREDKKPVLPNPKEDLWLSTVDGRYGSRPIPIRVGQLHNMQTFYVSFVGCPFIPPGN